MVPLHPLVERVVEKEIGQEGADNPALRRPRLGAAGAGRLRQLPRPALALPTLEERTRERAPLEWATTQMNLGKGVAPGPDGG